MSYDVVFLHPPSVVDHRKRPWFPGPIARTVGAMSPLFIMIPVGVLSMAEHLLTKGFKTKIVNLGEQILQSPTSKLDETIRSLDSKIFAIDLHWDVHSCGAIDTARICKEQHPNSFVLLGGLTASYFAQEIMSSFEFVNGVIRGEAEEAVHHFGRKGRERRELGGCSEPKLS